MNEENEEICYECDGSGLGMYAGNSCTKCGGGGILFTNECESCGYTFTSGKNNHFACCRECYNQLKDEHRGDR